MGLGNAHFIAEQGSESLAAYQRVFDRFKRVAKTDTDPAMAWAWFSIATGHLANGDWTDAEKEFELTLSFSEAAGFVDADLAEINFGLARARWALGRRSEAKKHAQLAIDGYQRAGQLNLRDEVASWLAALEPSHSKK